MNATVEIDKAGRLVVPKKVRDVMHLQPGERLELRCTGDKITIERERKPLGLHLVDGWPVYDSGGPPISSEEANRWISDAREERMARIGGYERKK